MLVGFAGQPKCLQERNALGGSSNFHTLHTHHTPVNVHREAKNFDAEASHAPTMLPRQPAHNKQEGGCRWRCRWCLDSGIGVTAEIRRIRKWVRRPRIGFSLIARPHDMARLAKSRLNRCVLNIVTSAACQTGFLPFLCRNCWLTNPCSRLVLCGSSAQCHHVLQAPPMMGMESWHL